LLQQGLVLMKTTATTETTINVSRRVYHN